MFEVLYKDFSEEIGNLNKNWNYMDGNNTKVLEYWKGLLSLYLCGKQLVDNIRKCSGLIWVPFLFFPQPILKCYFCSLFNFFSFCTHINSKNLFQSFLHFQSTEKQYWTKNGSVSISLFIYSLAICQTNINLRNTDFLFTWVLNLRSNPFCFCFSFYFFLPDLSGVVKVSLA